jgi:hypothetical protein
MIFSYTKISTLLLQYESTRQDWQELWQTLENLLISSMIPMLNFIIKHLAVDDVIVLFKGGEIFKQYFTKKHNSLV